MIVFIDYLCRKIVLSFFVMLGSLVVGYIKSVWDYEGRNAFFEIFF